MYLLKEKKDKALDFLDAVKGYHISLSIGLLLLCGYLLVRGDKSRVNFVLDHITTPYKRMMGYLCNFIPISVMELLYLLVGLLGIFVLVRGIVLTIRKPQKGLRVYKTIAFFLAAALLIGDGYNWLWGLNYYGDSFSDKSGLTADPVALEDLYDATAYYADAVNTLSSSIVRDTEGRFAEDLDEIFAASDRIYAGIISEYPFLDTPNRTPKRMIASTFMSAINFTGVYFPFTSETNLNDVSPAALIPSTIAHELAHQKNIAAEQEANFVAARACMTSDMPVYAYSGALLAYIHLGNALHDADYALWQQVYETLNEQVRADLDYNNAYWASYQTKGAEAAETVYEAFLNSYDQTLGMKSYGACVDLLVADYKEKADAAYQERLTVPDGLS